MLFFFSVKNTNKTLKINNISKFVKTLKLSVLVVWAGSLCNFDFHHSFCGIWSCKTCSCCDIDIFSHHTFLCIYMPLRRVPGKEFPTFISHRFSLKTMRAFRQNSIYSLCLENYESRMVQSTVTVKKYEYSHLFI